VSSARPRIGVLALQGDVREHLAMLRRAGAEAVAVRRPEELAQVDGLVLPGGESTTMVKLAKIFDLLDPLRERAREGLPMFGTCAGMILLADRIEGGVEGQETIGGLDVTVRRNAFGRQVDSFEADLELQAGVDEAGVAAATSLDGPFHAVFIRAPWVEQVGEGVEVLGTVASGPAAGRVVAVRQGSLMATSFHPEITGDGRVHAFFVRNVRSAESD
jgi:5'-phosphate synthase pdxT subunit